MHIYHYGAYEKTALLHLAARYGVGEDEVDDLLRDDVLVDLLPMVRKSIRVGAESYGLKALEPLYMGNDRRSGDVTTAADSITQYARYTALLQAGRADEAAGVLKEIEDYNHYDCRSTQLLRNRLLVLAFEHGVTHLTRPASPGEPVPPDDDIAAVLTGFAGDPAVSGSRNPRADGRRADQRRPWLLRPGAKTALVGALRPVDQPGRRVGRHLGVFRVDHADVIADWHLPPGKRKPRRHVAVDRRPAQRRAGHGQAGLRALRAAGAARHGRRPSGTPGRGHRNPARDRSGRGRCAGADRHRGNAARDGAFRSFADGGCPRISAQDRQPAARRRGTRTRSVRDTAQHAAAAAAPRRGRHPVPAAAAHRFRRCPAPHRHRHRLHHRGAARPRPVLRRGARARPAPARHTPRPR